MKEKPMANQGKWVSQHQVDTTILLNHERLRREVLAYITDHENDDPIELLKTFAEPLRVLIDCDQVIYRDLEETRIMVNSPAIADTWSVPIDYCRQCQHFDAHHPMYAGGYTEMNNCQEGWQGIPVYEKCPIKSSLTRIVYCDGEVAGYLAIHYVQKYHEFTDTERSTLEEFTRILSLSLSRYEARKRAGETNSVKKMLNMLFSLSSEYDPIIVVEPESGEYDWYMGQADELTVNTSMTLHGDNLYKNIGIDSASIIHPDDRAQFQAFYTRENMCQIAKTGEPQETENRWFLKLEGKYKWKYNKAVRMVDENGKVFVVVGVIDTTEAKEKEAAHEAEKQLLEQQSKLAETAQHLVESIASIYRFAFTVDMNGSYFRVIRMDDEVQKALGASDFKNYQEAIAPLFGMLHPGDRDRMAKELAFSTIRKKLKKTNSYAVTYRVIYNGATEWHEMNVNRIIGDEIALGFAEKDLEITKRHIEERRFSEYFGLYEADIDTGMFKVIIDSPYYTFSETGEAVPYEPAMRKFAEHQVGETKEFFMNLSSLDWVKKTLATDNKHSFPYFSVTAGHTWVDVTSYITQRHEDGTPAMFVLEFSFVSSAGAARQEMQRRLNENSQMISGLASGYFALFYINLNEAIFTVYDFDEKQLPEANHLLQEETDPFKMLHIFGASNLVHPDDRALFADLNETTIRERLADQKRFSLRYRRVNGDTYLWNEIVAVKTEAIEEPANAIVIGFSDCDEEIRKELEQQKQLEEALAMAQSANRAKTTFLNNMSHDIRTPMNAIIGYTGLAASHIDNKEQVQDYLSKIGQSSDHLLSLINDVLDMSRIESGKMNLDEKEENLSDIIHTLRDIVQHDIHAKEMDFFVDAVDVNDEDVICDKLRLNQVLLNILSNAIKYTGAGGTVILRVTEKTVKRSGYATYEFSVKDNGMGMDKEFLKTIFDPFTRVRSSTVSGIQGTGLGMAITKNIVDMMGGKIEIDSTPGKGTEVTISFDFKLQSAPKEPVVITELKGLRALVVDDDSNTCISIAKMIRDIGMREEWCTSGKEAVIRAKEAFHIGDLFKVYVIDWLMPDMNGIETTRRIRKVVGDEVPIIILTAYDWSDIEEEAKEAGVTAFVSKPMFPSDLHRALSSCFGTKDKEPKPEAIAYNFSGKKVLLVEDNELNREIATEILLNDGFLVDTAEDGSVAVKKMKKAKTGDYDLVLMDVQMPVLDGYETTKQIRALGSKISKIPIIAMTANAFEEDRKAALEAGMDEHIAKPIDLETLKSTLAKFLF